MLYKFVGIEIPKTLMGEADLIKAISRVNNIAWNLNHYYGTFFSNLELPNTNNSFNKHEMSVRGNRYVKALGINKRVAVYEIDDDADCSAYGIMIDGIPCMFIQSDSYPKSKNTWIVNTAAHDGNSLALPLNTVQDFFNLPEYIQCVMNDVLEKILILDAKLLDQKKSSMEKLINYS